jgi:hypothetical protein
MLRIACAVAVAAVAYTAVSGVTKAAPFAQLPAAVTTEAGSIIPVYYWHGRYYRYRWHGHYYRHRYYRYGHYRYW